jgi:transcriptional regulator with XRE-family HTH domain
MAADGSGVTAVEAVGAVEATPAAEAQKDKIGSRIARLMKARGLNQTTLAERSGIARSEINRIVNNRRDPRQEELAWLAQVLEVSLEELLGDAVLPDGGRKTLMLFEHLARQAEAALSERDEIAAQLKVANEENAAAQAREAEKCAELQKEIERLTAEVAHVKREKQELEAKLALKDVEIFLARNNLATERTQYAAKLRQVEAANGALRGQVAQLQQKLIEADRAKIATGVLAGLAGLFVGGGVGAAATRNDDETPR